VQVITSCGPISTSPTWTATKQVVGPTPASIQLALSSLVLAGGSAGNITATVRDASNNVITPTPAITYQILTLAGDTGGVPTVSGGQVLTSVDTRGGYTLRGTVTGTSVTADVRFAAIDGTAPPVGSLSTNAGRLVAFGAAEGTVTSKMAELSNAFATGNNAAIPAINAAMLAAAATVPVTGRNGMERTTAVAPDVGFIPAPSVLASHGFPETAADVTYGNLLNQIDAKFQQITAFYNTLNPASATNDEATLNQLNTDLAALQSQLVALNITPHGVVKYATRINQLVANTIPAHLQAITGRINTVLQQNSLASALVAPKQFYAAVGQPGSLGPNSAYMGEKPAFFGLLGLFAGCSLQMDLVNRIYGPIMEEVTRMIVIVAANGLLTTYTNIAQMEGIISGASLSFHAPFLPDSVIEGTGMNDNVPRNDVFFVGPEAVSAVQTAINSFNPSNIHNLQDLYKFFDGIVTALGGLTDAYNNAHKLPSDFALGCILDGGSNPSCSELIYGAGFPDVNNTHFPSPVIVLYHNMDTGFWSSGIFNFIP
jgi:hypothetical protein